MSVARALLDSNILVYSVDASNPSKQKVATAIMGQLANEGGGVLSSQCLVEFSNASTRKLPVKLAHGNAAWLVEQFAAAYRVYPVQADTVAMACRALPRYPLSFFDSLIWAVARMNRVPVILTEDTPGVEVIEGVAYVNPFEPSFDPATIARSGLPHT